MTDLNPLALARALAPDIAARALEIEKAGRIPADVIDRLAQAGLFRLCIPRALGGLEVDPITLVRVIEEIAAADGSTGWCLMIGATSGVTSAYLDDPAARIIYGQDPKAITGGVFAPRGAATTAPGGHRVTGRWPFASGCEHCTWLMGGSLFIENGAPRMLKGAPESRLMFFRPEDVTIHRTWNVSGLAGTGSHDIEVKDVFVPEGFSASIVSDRPRHEGPLYAFPVFGLLAIAVSAVALGIARAATTEMNRLASAKTPFGGTKPLGARPTVQLHIAEAEAALRAGRALLFETITEAYEEAKAGGAISLTRRAALRLAACHAVTSAARATDIAYQTGGATSIYATSPLQRAFRDIHVATQHAMVSPVIMELVGRVRLGHEVDTWML